jgi:prevent-host-death family protein
MARRVVFTWLRVWVGLDEEAAKAVGQWRFNAGTVDGKAVRVQVGWKWRSDCFSRSIPPNGGNLLQRTVAIDDGYLDSYHESMTYTVAEAKNRLPELIKQAEAGASVTITKRGIPVVEIVRKVDEPRAKRVFGVLGKKKVVIDPEWARPQEDLDAWLAGEV